MPTNGAQTPILAAILPLLALFPAFRAFFGAKRAKTAPAAFICRQKAEKEAKLRQTPQFLLFFRHFRVISGVLCAFVQFSSIFLDFSAFWRVLGLFWEKTRGRAPFFGFLAIFLPFLPFYCHFDYFYMHFVHIYVNEYLYLHANLVTSCAIFSAISNGFLQIFALSEWF